MTTNFYWHDDQLVCQAPCEHCANTTVIHVGQYAGGWSFGFRGWTDEQSPFGFPVMSRVDWREVLKRPGRLVDEHDRVEPDPAAWLDSLEAPGLAQIRKENGLSHGYVWDRDAEGFRITTDEFS